MPAKKSSDPAADAENQTEGAVTMPQGAQIVDEPLSTASPDTVKQPVADPNEEAKATYRKDLVDGKPLEINERPARLAGNIAGLAGFGYETAEDRTQAHQERVKQAAKADDK